MASNKTHSDNTHATPDWPAAPPLSALVNRTHCIDALELLRELPDASVDMVLTDPPYAVTEAAWDTAIDWSAYWPEFKRVLTPRGAMVVTCVMRFAWRLIALDPDFFKYDMVGVKNVATDFLSAKNKPMRLHENVLVFSHGTTANRSPALMNYYPQMQPGKPWWKFDYARTKGSSKTTIGVVGRRAFSEDRLRESGGSRYPTTLIPQRTMNVAGNYHPNEKPVDMFEYLISSYTLPGMLVLDPFAGSGTTAVAARNLNRRFIAGDFLSEYVDIAQRRLAAPYTPNMFVELAS